MTQHIASCMQQAIDYLGEHPEQARYTDTPAVAVIENGLRAEVTGSGSATVITDMPEAVGGSGAAPSPGWMMRAALAACDATLIAMRAAQEGIELQKIEVTVDSESDDRGLLGIGDAPAGPLSTRVRVKLSASGTDPAQLEKVVEWAHEHSPVGDAVRRPVPTTVEVEATA